MAFVAANIVTPVIPAKAGTQLATLAGVHSGAFWIPAFGGMTDTLFHVGEMN